MQEPLASSSNSSNTPPPLPDRSKSVGELSVKKTVKKIDSDPLGEHYAHLDKHVKEVRRRRNNAAMAPILADFQVKKNDQIIATNWIKFMEAVNNKIPYCMMVNLIPHFRNNYLVDKIFRSFRCIR